MRKVSSANSLLGLGLSSFRVAFRNPHNEQKYDIKNINIGRDKTEALTIELCEPKGSDAV